MKKSPVTNSLSRAKASLEFDKYYKRIPTGGVCFYCGKDAQTGDHVPPLSSVRKRDLDTLFWLVPSCQRCNNLLGTHQSQDLAVRCRYLRKSYETKGEEFDFPTSPGDLYAWIMPPLNEDDLQLIGKLAEGISGDALVYVEGRLSGDFRRSVMHFTYHRNKRIARGILSGLLGRALDAELCIWGFGTIPSMYAPDPRPISDNK